LSQNASPYDSQFEENLYNLRRDKLAQIADLVRVANPALSDIEAKYPNTFAFTHTIPEARAIGEHLTTEDLAERHIEAAIAGRIMAIRVQGKAGFATLQQNGQRLQIYVRKDDVGEDLFALYKLLDLGDHIGVRGYLMRTRTGELTLHASPIALPGEATSSATDTPAVRAAPITFLAKAMLALPDKFHGLEDIELRYRRRYLDLFTDTGDIKEAPEERDLKESPAENAVILSEGRSPQSKDLHDLTPQQAPSLLSAPELTRLPAREVFVKRAAILRSIRKFFDDRHYLEVETPMLHTISGGAAARPFETHHNALDIPLKLRIAPELYLKRLVVGGLDRVYEINRNFRNEGVSTQHNPEFTMLEFYQAYANYKDLMKLTKELVAQVAIDVNDTTKTNFNGEEIDLAPEKWQELTMLEAIDRWWDPHFGSAPQSSVFSDSQLLASTLENAIAEAKANSSVITANTSPEQVEPWARYGTIERALTLALADLVKGSPIGKITASVFEVFAEPHLIQPTIIYDFPLAVSPLSKVKPNEPDWVERFEFYIGGFEVGNAFSELNDPDDQRARFEAQLREKERGDDEAMPMDEDYVRALGYGLPPTAGEGIGIDRLTMILTGSRSIRDVILFPLMRPQKPTPDPETANEPHGESAE
jgi:lysyl-tRNA synthetase class 2